MHWLKVKVVPGFFIGVRRKGREQEWFFYEGAATPSPSDRGSGECCELPSGVQGGASTAQRFSTIFSAQDDLF